MSKLKYALELAAAGHRVFPLTPNGKTPAHAGANWRVIASSDPARVAEMWTDPVFETELDYNIGIALDKNTLVVDVDVRNGKKGAESLALLEAIYDDLPASSRSQTASGGLHYWLKVDGNSGDFPAQLATDIDLKGEGGYVVAPGSEIDGRLYLWISEPGSGADQRKLHGSASNSGHADCAECPQWVIDHAAPGRKRNCHPLDDGNQAALQPLDTESAVSRAIDWLENHAPDAIEGAGGDNTTIKVANHVGDFGVSAPKTAELMLDRWNDTKASPPWDADELTAKVASAFRSRQNPIGIASAEAEFDAVEIDAKAPPKRKGLDVRNITSFGWSTAQGGYLVQGFLNYKMLAMMSAPSNAGKSPLALDLAAHIALGRPWRCRKVKPAYVFHYSTEGFTGLGNRMEALRREHFEGAANVPFDFVSGSLDLRTSTRDAKAIIEAVRARSAEFGVSPGLVVIDTLSHALGGGDESNPEHVRAVLKNCAEIAGRTGAAVLILHHPTKDASSDYRGSSIMLNDIDLMIKVEVDAKTKRRTVTTPRVKEFAEIDPLQFNIKVVRLGEDEEGDPITSIVVDWVDAVAAEFDVTLSPAAQEMFDIMEQMDAVERDAIDAGEGGAESDKCDIWMPWNALQMSFLSQIKGAKGKGVGRSALFKIRQELSQAGKIKRDQQNQWAIVRSH